ncbi:hypothetical protein P4283_29535 [Bacillus thuringiensis]|nr:hypothetical protein [Bacillus thuringiensis]
MLSNVYIEQREDVLKIEWQGAEIYIPVQEIIEVTDHFTGCRNNIVNIGTPFFESEIVMIKTKKISYVLFNVDKNVILHCVH